MAELNVVGRRYPLRDARPKVDGSAKYAGDIQLPGMLYARVLGSPHPHAMVKKINVGAAEALPGVKAVVTSKDATVMVYPSETRGYYALDDHLRCVGDEFAAVAAESEEIAEEALGLIKVEYEILPTVYSPIDAAKPDAPKLHPDGNVWGTKPVIIEWGDLEKAVKDADFVAEGSFRTQIQHTAPMELSACTVDFDQDGVTAWVSTQYPHKVRDDLATLLGLPLQKVRVLSHFMGGGFGGKKQQRYYLIAALLARKTGRPVQLTLSRQEMHMIGRRRYSSIANVKVGAKKDGGIDAFSYECYYDIGAYGNWIGGSTTFVISSLIVYRWPNARYVGYDVNTNLITAQPMRSVQMCAFHFAVEQLLDQVAERLNKDPAELRLNNSYKPGDKMLPFGDTLSSYALEECIKKALDASGWKKKWKGWSKPVDVIGSKRRGIGFATSMGWGAEYREYTSAMVKIEKDGSAVLYTGTQDLGTGSNTTLCQIVAEELGISIGDVGLVAGDTRATPHDLGALSSRTMFCGGLAVRDALRDAKRRVLRDAAPILKVSPDELEMKDKRVYVKADPARSIPINELLPHSIAGESHLKPVPTVAPLRPKLYVGGAMTHVVEVEVDVETGEVRLLNYTAAHDVGKAINPAVVENQIYGAVLQGIGYALTEELIFDPTVNAYLNPDFLDYKILTAKDTPPITPIIVESNEPTGPYGAKGIGELGLNPAAGAIANAIYNAIGVRLTELPMTPERILRALTEH